MTDTGADGSTHREEPFADEDRLPWLETADEDFDDGPSPGRMALLVVVGLVIVSAIVGGYLWLSNHRGGSGNGELIAAQEGDYKVKPNQAGGMKVAGEGDARYVASEGGTTNGSVDVNALPEAPVDGKRVAPKKQAPDKGAAKVVAQVPTSAEKVAAKAPAQTSVNKHSSGGGGSVVQLGSFPNQSGAKTAWSRLSKRFSYLEPLGETVQKAEVNGNTVYRLRVNAGSASAAKELCGKLKVAGEACYIPAQ
ncbi:SPOR domain-containing protein [Stakelama marina]|uniref:SPOR domain-containing protein n=1 Tax=Stakelama marina TaxID=2826939 RepID=A0A8T4I9W5_9SPHN|nr:SPOR domain-containing protein [Stakelama marina]MBR0551143.1 SPOR domain-containing protein [Stakelama marina]